MSTNCRVRFIAVLIALLLGPSLASAAFNFTGQTRYVYGALGGNLGGAGPQQINAPNNFNVFDATTSLTVPTYGGIANQHQHSELLPNAILISGNVDIFRPAEVGTGWAEARSYSDIVFDLATSTDVTLSASGTASIGGVAPIHNIKLTGPSNNIIVWWDSFGPGFPQTSGSKLANVTLPAGNGYHLLVDLQSYKLRRRWRQPRRTNLRRRAHHPRARLIWFGNSTISGILRSPPHADLNLKSWGAVS